jgi:putative membrane protein insertion efficiency factor
MKRLLTAPIRFYRRYLSGLKRAPTCRFVPTCSEYALEAIDRRGPVVGMFKALWRIVRCNPLCRGGYDPVDGARTEHQHGPACEHVGPHLPARTRRPGIHGRSRPVAGHP